jgi:protein-L-isoaspartate O-methyltransferase
MKKIMLFFLERIQLLWLNLVVKKRNFIEFIKVIKRYYPNPLFRAVDLSLLSKYLFKSPFSISKAFMESKGEQDVYVYGETPLTTLEVIAKECGITRQDTVFELGAGRGRGCFWLATMIGCRVVGIEYIPEFIAKAQAVQQKYNLNLVEFREQDFLQANFKGATVVYLYGTCMDQDAIQRLIRKLARLPKGTKIITVSYSLKEFTDDRDFEVLKRFKANFTWGSTDVYLQRSIT